MLRKYTRTESNARVVSPGTHQVIQDELKRHAKTSVDELTDEQREALTEKTVAQSQRHC